MLPSVLLRLWLWVWRMWLLYAVLHRELRSVLHHQLRLVRRLPSSGGVLTVRVVPRMLWLVQLLWGFRLRDRDLL
jgi:hypothetical protein